MVILIWIITVYCSCLNGFASGVSLPANRYPAWKLAGYPDQGPPHPQPEQVHLSYGGDPTLIWVTWLTYSDTGSSQAQFGIDVHNLTRTVNGTVSRFVDGGPLKSIRYIHRVQLSGIRPGVVYYYRVGSDYGWSHTFHFRGLQPRSGGSGGCKFAVYGKINPRSLAMLQSQAQRRQFDMVLHVGDFAYNMDTNDGAYGDEFMRMIESIAAYVPYMTVVGNHEQQYNFSHYVNRFTMPDSEQNFFYNFDLGLMHFVVFSTEFYFYTEYGLHQIENQWQWLKNDLEKANRNRHIVPWIITMGHRPMYCSDDDKAYCDQNHGAGIIRKSLEQLFYSNAVDLELWAHEHSYERLWPVYNQTVYYGSDATTLDAYINPPAPVHIISGSAGCDGLLDPFTLNKPPWSAFRSSSYGFGRMHVVNATHLYYEQLSAAEAAITDRFWLVKESHGKFDPVFLQKHGKYYA